VPQCAEILLDSQLAAYGDQLPVPGFPIRSGEIIGRPPVGRWEGDIWHYCPLSRFPAASNFLFGPRVLTNGPRGFFSSLEPSIFVG
jgi:hypothetical protein